MDRSYKTLFHKLGIHNIYILRDIYFILDTLRSGSRRLNLKVYTYRLKVSYAFRNLTIYLTYSICSLESQISIALMSDAFSVRSVSGVYTYTYIYIYFNVQLRMDTSCGGSQFDR